MFCHNCGSIIADTATQCRHCSVSVQPVVSSEPAADATPPPVPSEPAATPADSATPTAAPAPPPAETRFFCRHCGHEMAPGASRCAHCDALRTPPPPAHAASHAGSGEERGPYDWGVALALCCIGFVFPIHGIHRFYTGQVGLGLLQLLTFGGCFVWTIIEVVFIATDNYRDVNGYKLRR